MSRALVEPHELLTAWSEGDRIFISAEPQAMTTAQAREAAGKILDLADEMERRPEVTS